MLYNWFNLWGPCSDQAGYGYPYSNFHQLNLDWFLGEFKKIVEEMLEHETQMAGKVNKSGDTMSGPLNMGDNTITALKTPVNNSDAANKSYVDSTRSSVPMATDATLGGIKAAPVTNNDTQDVHITSDGHLKTQPTGSGGGSNITVVQTTGTSTTNVMSQKAVTDNLQNINNAIPTQATNTNLGTVKAGAATSNDTIDVHITADGHLKTQPSGSNITVVQTTGTSTTNVMSQKAVTDIIPTQATDTTLGTIKAAPATPDDIQDIRITPDGYLKTKPQTGGTSSITVVQTTGSSTADVMSQKAVTDKIQEVNDAIPTQATDTTLGTIKAGAASLNDTQDIHITSDGHLKTTPNTYTLPVANNTTLGGVLAAAATQLDTQDVHITADGHLKTQPSGGSGGGLQPITVTRPAAYITTTSNTNTTQILADPTAPQARPIARDQIAVYSETNQTYREEDVTGTLLVADPHSNMESVNKRYANNTYLQLSGAKKMTGNIDMDTFSITNLGTPTNINDAANKTYVDTAISGKISTPTIKSTLAANGTALSANTIYNCAENAPLTTYTFTPPTNNGWAHGFVTSGATPAWTFSSDSKFIGEAPTFTGNTRYEFDVYFKTWIFAKVVTA